MVSFKVRVIISTVPQSLQPGVEDEQLHVLPWYSPLTTDGLEVRLGGEGRDVGGLAFSLPHGSLLLEVAKHKVHATTTLCRPNRLQPTRIGMVFYTHAGLNVPDHGKKACEDEERPCT